MVRTIDHAEISEAERGELQIVEVLPAPEYRDMHLPGAESIPLKTLDRDAVSHLDRERPVVVYCWDAY